jgi:ketosteroid isomerase-like protein
LLVVEDRDGDVDAMRNCYCGDVVVLAARCCGDAEVRVVF